MRDLYSELIAGLPVPTVEQTDNFATYVVGARSWYKHLPVRPPGERFVFFLDPNAGRSLVMTADGRFAYSDRVDEKERFHYTWMRTTEYRTRFGYWQYATGAGDTILFRAPRNTDTQIVSSGSAHVLAPDGTELPVSPAVLTAGTVSLTAHVHTEFSAGYVHGQAHMFREIHKEHPEHASVGQELLALDDRYAGDYEEFESILYAEKIRQRMALRAALLSVRAILART